MKIRFTSKHSSHRTNHYSSLRIAAFVALVALIGIPLFSSSLASSTSQNSRALSSPTLASGKAAAANSIGVTGNFLNAGRSLTLSSSPQGGETIAIFAADCTTPKSVFLLGETVCAKTNSVDLNFSGGRWVDWIYSGTTSTVVSGSRTTTLITTNPQTFAYTPTTTGLYKADITEDDGNGGDNPQTASNGFTVQLPTLSTYASGCTTPKASFNLGETVCVKVSGLTNDEWPYRRVQFASPDGFALHRSNVLDNSQQSTYVLPSAANESFGSETINHLGTWNVSLIDTDANLKETVQITVHKSSLLVDRVADLQATKLYIDQGDPATAGGNVLFAIFLYNAGPDPATTVTLNDVTLPNTTFVSFVQIGAVANVIPRSHFGTSFKDNAITTDFVRFLQDSAPDSSFNDAFSSTNFLLAPQSPLTFNCVTPSAGSAGTTTCTANREIAPGETASFTAIYKVDANVANGASLTDDNSVTVQSSTADPATPSNTSPVDITTSNPNPPACTLTCPDNITVGTNAVNGQGAPGATVTFGPEAAGTCGTGLTSTPSSGSFFPVGSTTVTSQTGSGATCSFVVTVVNAAQPTITCPSNKTAAATSGQSEVSVSVGTPAFTGSLATVGSHRSDERDVSEPYPIGLTTVTWTVRDQYGTTASCDQTVTVTSSDTPTISCPSDKAFTATSGCTFTANSAQIGTPTTTGASVTVSKERSDGLGLTDPYPAGKTYIEWTVTNSVGSASCTQTITVNATDTTAPALVVPPGITLSTSSCSVLLDDELGVATADDDCSQSVNITRTGVPRVACPIPSDLNRTCESFVFPTGTTIITYTASDSAGNVATGTQTIRITESPAIPPTIDAPADLTINTGSGATSCGTVIGNATLGTATATDNCPGVTVARTGVPVGNVFPVGTTVVTYTATDGSGNMAQDTQNVTVVDNTPPVLTCPANVTVYLPLNSTAVSMPVSYPNASATDNCPGTPTIGYSIASGSVFPVGPTTVTVTATDAHSNSSTCQFTVTVLYDFTGFFAPVDNIPVFNSMKAGQAVPVKFSLSGNKGLNIFASGSPASVSINCQSGAPEAPVEETVNAGGSSLSYSSGGDQYNYVWKTDGSWKNTCRQLTVTLNDGSQHVAYFKFK